ncbi:hypothetical protein J5Y04_12085 [Kitasatospora sp. RG8]|uniref:DUF6193 family natural product biosynthesis protein n=1 Tax=Kitasatospora sp. RG8 TaxID=2820815 RepID=UPI001ADF0A11|nr:DUF6193 family natural product biosynthesis protein [Kitasatospora sp. RG8]MBP0450289.1 hypothetical protein [Kitasatospora sp. RG8]
MANSSVGLGGDEDEDEDAVPLAALLRRTAEELGVGLPEPAGAWERIVEFKDDETGRRVVVYPPRSGHPYQARFNGHGAPLAGGLTGDVAEVVGATAAWMGGAGLEATAAAAPFVRFREWALAQERAPLDPVELMWMIKLDRVHLPPYDRHPRPHALLAAAYAQPVLRRLMPVNSHFNLWFSTGVETPWKAKVGGTVDPNHEGRYAVWHDGEPVACFDTAEEAVALVVARLPEGTGPAR